ncbi:MAG: hypothetical protein U0R80_20080 [Nocardioidaceae bacterium]
MTDDELTPAQEERVRRLLADARHTAPMPDDVVARLDAVIAGLAEDASDDGAADAASSGVVSLDAARRRRGRRGRALLVAAAAVTVIGVGTPALLSSLQGMSGSADSTSAGSAADAPEAATQDDGGKAFQGSGGSRSRTPKPNAYEASSLPSLDASAFSAQVKRLSGDDALRSTSTHDSASDLQSAPCVASKALGKGRFLPATYDGVPAVLVWRSPQDDRQRVDLFLCGDTAPTRSVVIPMP